MKNATIRRATISDLARCCEIESLCYSDAEAASDDKIKKRIEQYPEGFIVLESDGKIVGFINSAASNEVNLADEDLKDLSGHDSAGKYVVILSVATHPDCRGEGVSSRLMHHFVASMKDMNKAVLYLICKSNLVGMYKKYGFVDLGVSESTYGGLRWHEMSLSLEQT